MRETKDKEGKLRQTKEKQGSGEASAWETSDGNERGEKKRTTRIQNSNQNQQAQPRTDCQD